MTKEIFKIQIPLEANVDNPPLLVYNKDRSVFVHMNPTDEIIRVMKGRPKAFFRCEFNRENQTLFIHEETFYQEW